jgi:hypothetical protein
MLIEQKGAKNNLILSQNNFVHTNPNRTSFSFQASDSQYADGLFVRNILRQRDQLRQTRARVVRQRSHGGLRRSTLAVESATLNWVKEQ